MLSYHADESYNGNTYCVNFSTSAPVTLKEWQTGACSDKTLVFDAHAYAVWDGKVWSA